MSKTTTQDDYLICREYKEQIGKKNAAYPGFISFEHENGNHYFAWVNNDEIVMRSEAYPDADKMERGIKAILKNCDLPERYSVIEEHGAHILLMWGGGDHTKHTGNMAEHSEIGRSCPHKTREELNELLQFKGKDFANKVVPIAAAKVAAAAPAAASTVAAAATTVAAAATTVAAASTTSTTNNSYSTSTPVANTDGNSGGGMGWLKWLLPLLLLAGIAYWWNSCRGNAGSAETATTEPAVTTDPATTSTTTATVTATDTPAAASTATVAATTKQSTKVKLACGSEIDAYQGGIESNLVKFLDDKSAAFNPEDKKANWINFDNMNFEFGTSKLTGESISQIKNLVAILGCYKGLKIKIGGYTDKVGADAGNLKLSQSRADAIMKALLANGAGKDQITGAEGYGETLATVAETATDAERAIDRKTAVRIMAR